MKAYGYQIENKLRLSKTHITKEEFLPAFFIAHQQIMTLENITAGFSATGHLLFNPGEVLSNLCSVVRHTISSKGSHSS